LSIYLKKIIAKSEKRFFPVIKLWQNAQKSVDFTRRGRFLRAARFFFFAILRKTLYYCAVLSYNAA
jgi:hypothetical protein